MGPAEILHRGWRTAAKRIPRRRIDDRLPLTESLAACLLPQVMADDPALCFATRTAVRGFFSTNERPRLASVARAHLRPEVARAVATADAIVTDGIELLGRRFHPTRPDFDWLADPERGRCWPLAVLDDSDAVRGAAADVKFVWEVNRHQFLVTLARAAIYTGDEQYARHCITMARRWIATNPAGLGVNWASNLEVAMRAISWVWTLQFLLGTPALGNDDLRLWLASLRQHRDHLDRHLSVYTDPTNHLIGEAAALAIVAIWLPEWDNSARLRDRALATLAGEIERQVAEDGVDREQSTSYQRFVLDLILQVIALAHRNQLPLPTVLVTRAAAMLDAIRALVGPNQQAPRIGDSDDARGVPFVTADHWDFAEILALGDAVLGLSDSAQLPARYESALWLAGETALAQPQPRPRAQRRSELLAHGGYAILRSTTGPEQDRLVFDCGPLGYLPHASHGHADLLSVLVDVGGEEMLIDPGTFAYYDEHGRRDLFRSTRMHNTVEIGGRDQADAFDPFKWLNLPRNGRELFHRGHGFDYVEAWHDGYRRLRPAVRHRRAVVGLAGGWLLIDWLEGRGRHHFTRWFHALPGAGVELVGAATVRLSAPSGRGRLIVQDLAAANALEPTIVTSAVAPYSERYAEITQAPAIGFADHATLPAVRLTLLAVQPSDTPPLLVRAVSGERQAGAVWVSLGDASGALVDVVVRTTTAPTRIGAITTDARTAIARRDRSGTAEPEVLLSGGRQIDGIRAH
ncbi:MAG: alginate lyase family protein [Deltaproteobacteria bacterium]|nr:alginate lyase family protein [Deltaproteobacteria bacterium]